MTSAAGHSAEDWRGKQMWTGDCKIVMEGSQKCKIQFINSDGSKFAESVMNDEHYEKFV